MRDLNTAASSSWIQNTHGVLWAKRYLWCSYLHPHGIWYVSSVLAIVIIEINGSLATAFWNIGDIHPCWLCVHLLLLDVDFGASANALSIYLQDTVISAFHRIIRRRDSFPSCANFLS